MYTERQLRKADVEPTSNTSIRVIHLNLSMFLFNSFFIFISIPFAFAQGTKRKENLLP